MSFWKRLLGMGATTAAPSNPKPASQDITEIMLNKSLRPKVSMNNGLDARCPQCGGIKAHEPATPDSVGCVGCRRPANLIWVKA